MCVYIYIYIYIYIHAYILPSDQKKKFFVSMILKVLFRYWWKVCFFNDELRFLNWLSSVFDYLWVERERDCLPKDFPMALIDLVAILVLTLLLMLAGLWKLMRKMAARCLRSQVLLSPLCWLVIADLTVRLPEITCVFLLRSQPVCKTL